MTKHISVDIETLGTKPGSAIISLGAVVFDPLTGQLGESFYTSFNATCMIGFTTDKGTIDWWKEQSEQAKAMLSMNNMSLEAGLDSFYLWWKDIESDCALGDYARFWAKPPSFDEVLLDAAYKIVGIKTPWHYRAPRCVRTILDIAGIEERPMEGIPHYALADAVHQAQVVIDCYKALRS